jgi:hypothetical protein
VKAESALPVSQSRAAVAQLADLAF